MKMCLEVLKVERKNRTEVHVYAHDQCQGNLSMGWLVCACITIFHEVITIFFLAVLWRPNTFWSMYPGTVWCTQMLQNAILQKKRKKHCYHYKDFNHRCKGGYILGKTPVSLPITTGYSLPPTWNRFRQKRQSNLEWPSKTVPPCIGSHTFLIDGSWLLPTKRLFRSAANFDFHDNRPKMADLKSVYKARNAMQCPLLVLQCWQIIRRKATVRKLDDLHPGVQSTWVRYREQFHRVVRAHSVCTHGVHTPAGPRSEWARLRNSARGTSLFLPISPLLDTFCNRRPCTWIVLTKPSSALLCKQILAPSKVGLNRKRSDFSDLPNGLHAFVPLTGLICAFRSADFLR